MAAVRCALRLAAGLGGAREVWQALASGLIGLGVWGACAWEVGKGRAVREAAGDWTILYRPRPAPAAACCPHAVRLGLAGTGPRTRHAGAWWAGGWRP